MMPEKICLITFLQNKGNLNPIHMHQDVFEIKLQHCSIQRCTDVFFILYRPRNIDVNQFNLNNFVEEKMYVKPPNDLQLANG